MNITKSLGILLVLIFITSFVFSLYADISPHADAKAYNHIAWNLVRGFGYLENEDLLADNANRKPIHLQDDAIIRVGPGYEFFLASIYSLKGFDLAQNYATPGMWKVVWLVHALLRALTALLLFKIALLLFPAHQKKEWIGLAAATLFGFFPDLILINAFLLYETLLLFFGVAGVYFSLKVLAIRYETNFSNPRRGRAKFAQQILGISDLQKFVSWRNSATIFASLFWALAILTRPSELLSFLVFPATLLWQKHWRAVFISFLFPILLVGGWSLRNSLLYDQPLFTTTAGAYALWVGNNKHATGGYDRPPELREARNTYHSTELSAISIKQVAKFIREHPVKFLKLQIRKTATYFSLIRPTGFWIEFENTPGKRLVIVVSSALATALIFLGGTIGAWYALQNRSLLFAAFLGFALAKPLATIPLYVETRYRYGLYPLLALTAAFFLIQLVTSPRRATFIKTMEGVLAIFLVITSIDAWYSLDIIINRLSSLLNF